MKPKAPIDILVDATGGGRPAESRRTVGRGILIALAFFMIVSVAYMWYPQSVVSKSQAGTQPLNENGSPSPKSSNPSLFSSPAVPPPVEALGEIPNRPPLSSSAQLTSSALKKTLQPLADLKIYIYQQPFFEDPKWRDEVVQCYDQFLRKTKTSSIAVADGLGQSLFSRDSGIKIWQNDPVAAEIVFFNRLLRSHWATDNPAEAALFYVPYYIGLAWRCSRVDKREPVPYDDDAANLELWEWLRHNESSYFHKNSASATPHLFISSALFSDVTRSFVESGSHKSYYLGVFEHGFIDPVNDPTNSGNFTVKPVSLPIPSAVHLTTETANAYQRTLLDLLPREFLVAFVGDKASPLRAKIASSCERHPEDCLMQYFNSTSESTDINLMSAAYARKRATFCFEAHPGSAWLINHKGFWDALTLGCIPVIFGEDDILSNLPFQTLIDWKKLVVLLPSSVVDPVASLEAIPTATSTAMSKEIIANVRHLQYSNFDDDFDALSMFLREIGV